MQPKEMERLSAIQMDMTVFVFTFALQLEEVLLFGLARPLETGKIDLARSLKEVRQTSNPAGRRTAICW